VQVLLTTHSPHFASKVDLERLIIVSRRRCYPLLRAYTKLDPTDYEFLRRFLDVTKANLFFARGVTIVEGDAENLMAQGRHKDPKTSQKYVHTGVHLAKLARQVAESQRSNSGGTPDKQEVRTEHERS